MRLEQSLLEGLRHVLAVLRRACSEARICVLATARKVGPSGFSDPSAETAFLDQYRMAGLKSTSYACCVAITGYLLIGTVEIAFDGWSAASAFRRFFLVLVLSLIVLLIAFRPASLLRRYTSTFGVLVGTAYICSVSITHLFRSDDATAVVNPTVLMGLWMIYGFVRLPLYATVLIGVAGGCMALLGSRVTNMPDPAVRTFVYLLIGNALGITMSRSIEIRERQLFLQKRFLEEAQVELRRRSQLAEQASAEKTRLIAAVGHDLRQPMMAARLHLSVMMQRLDDGDLSGANRQAQRVEQSVQLLGDTLEHLLLAARYDAGTEPVSVQAVALRDVFDRLIHLCEPQAQEQNTSLLIRVPRSDVRVQTDERILLRVLVNLVTNGLKFSKSVGVAEPSRVVVRAAVVGNRCEIVVIDNGIGIAAADIDAIWAPFFQIGNKERNRGSGIGLGLFLVRQSLRALEGHHVDVRSTPGAGTCFTLSLPGIRAAPLESNSERVVKSNELRGAVDLRGMHVLLIEDDSEARGALETQLEAWGIAWSSGPSLEEILPHVMPGLRHVDAILADFRLPGGADGITTIDQLRSRLGYCPAAVLITAEVDIRTLTRNLPVNCTLIQKPFEPVLLYRSLAGASPLSSLVS